MVLLPGCKCCGGGGECWYCWERTNGPPNFVFRTCGKSQPTEWPSFEWQTDGVCHDTENECSRVCRPDDPPPEPTWNCRSYLNLVKTERLEPHSGFECLPIDSPILEWIAADVKNFVVPIGEPADGMQEYGFYTAFATDCVSDNNPDGNPPPGWNETDYPNQNRILTLFGSGSNCPNDQRCDGYRAQSAGNRFRTGGVAYKIGDGPDKEGFFYRDGDCKFFYTESDYNAEGAAGIAWTQFEYCTECRDGTTKEEPVATKTTGPGTELAKTLASWGFKESAKCSCKKMSRLMDGWGAACATEPHLTTIIDHLQKEAKKRGLPFVRKVGEMLVKRAVRKSQQNS